MRVNIKNRKLFVWVCYVRQRESTSVIWMSKMYPTRSVLENYKTFLSENGLNTDVTMLTEKCKIITNYIEISNIMNNYFTKIIEH